jgi:hypothetical protein
MASSTDMVAISMPQLAATPGLLNYVHLESNATCSSPCSLINQYEHPLHYALPGNSVQHPATPSDHIQNMAAAEDWDMSPRVITTAVDRPEVKCTLVIRDHSRVLLRQVSTFKGHQ